MSPVFGMKLESEGFDNDTNPAGKTDGGRFNVSDTEEVCNKVEVEEDDDEEVKAVVGFLSFAELL